MKKQGLFYSQQPAGGLGINQNGLHIRHLRTSFHLRGPRRRLVGEGVMVDSPAWVGSLGSQRFIEVQKVHLPFEYSRQILIILTAFLRIVLSLGELSESNFPDIYRSITA